MKERALGFILFYCAYNLIEGVLFAALIIMDGGVPIWFYLVLMALVLGDRWLMEEKRSGRSVHEKILLGGLCGAIPMTAAVFYQFKWWLVAAMGLFFLGLFAEWRWRTFSRWQERREEARKYR